jgi:two-component system chemotaxis sensor kinase CheA
MAFEMDEEILQDFLVEASEIHEQLGQQLVDFENTPEDTSLVNAIFRAFHTIKGGASFLSLTNLVELCHKAEDTFDLIRSKEIKVDEKVISLFLEVYDELTDMFEALHAGQDIPAANPETIVALKALCVPQSATQVPEPISTVAPADALTTPQSNQPVDLEDEFEAMMDSNAGVEVPEPTVEDEFEAMMDSNAGVETTEVSSPAPSQVINTDIGDDEFESLLDNMYGMGKFSEDASPIENLNHETVKPDATVESSPTPSSPAVPKISKTPAKATKTDSSVRVDISVLDHIMNMVGELVLVRNRLVTLETGKDSGEIDKVEFIEEVEKSVANLDVVTSDLQLAVMKTRMQPIFRVFNRFPRVVRDLAKKLKKDLRVAMEGETTDLDKNLVEELADPLIHLVRNSADHGIELPAIREAAGKNKQGIITLGASQQGDSIVLTIADDGAGIDADRVRKIAVDKGVISPEEAGRMSDNDAFLLIFAPGFSTTEVTTDVSGRGVGMDVVKTKITQLNGSIQIDSEKGVGTTITIRVPLTLAIMPTLTVRVGPQIFALPLANVKEILSLDGRPTNNVDQKRLLPLRNRTIPIYYLKHWLIEGANTFDHPTSGHVVVVEVNSEQVGFIVDGLIGQEEVVIKPLGDAFRHTPGLAGATITGNGRVSIILDLQGLIQANT